MIKNLQGWEMSSKLKEDFVVVKSFPGAKTDCMNHYLIPSLKQKPDNIILHVGANDLQSTDTASKIASRIIDLAHKCVNNFGSGRVMVSGLISRGDNLNGKA